MFEGLVLLIVYIEGTCMRLYFEHESFYVHRQHITLVFFKRIVVVDVGLKFSMVTVNIIGV